MRTIPLITCLMVMTMLSPARGDDGDRREGACNAKCEREMMEYQRKAGNNAPATSFAIDSCVDQCKKGITMDGDSDILKLCSQACDNVLVPMNLRNNPKDRRRCMENCVEVATRNLLNFFKDKK